MNWTPPPGFKFPSMHPWLEDCFQIIESGLIEQGNYPDRSEHYYFRGDYEPLPDEFIVARFHVKPKP